MRAPVFTYASGVNAAARAYSRIHFTHASIKPHHWPRFGIGFRNVPVEVILTKMNDEPIPSRSVERMFPFVLRSRILLLGREVLSRSKAKLHFILITTDISENSRQEVLQDFRHYPVVQHYTSADLEKFFGLRNAKVVGFQKSGLAQSIYAELKEHRINQPVPPKPKAPEAPPANEPSE